MTQGRIALAADEHWTPSKLDEVNVALRTIQRRTELEAFAAAGQLLLDTFFAGSVAAWESHSPRKCFSLRKLAERPGAPFKKDALSKRLGVRAALERHPFILNCPALTASHVVLVLRLPNDQQAAELKRAASEGWGVRAFRKHLIAVARERGERRGAPSSTAAQRSLNELRRCRDVLQRAAAKLEMLSPSAGVPPKLRAAARRDVLEIVALTTRLERSLQAPSDGPALVSARVDSAPRKRVG